MSSGNDEITVFLSEWEAGELNGDAAALEGLLTDDFVGIGPLGFILPRQAWLQRFAEGLRYDEFSLDDTQTRGYGAAAVVVGRQRQRGSHQGNPLPFDVVRASLVLVRQPERWRLASMHMSFIAGTPGAPPIPGGP